PPPPAARSGRTSAPRATRRGARSRRGPGRRPAATSSAQYRAPAVQWIDRGEGEKRPRVRLGTPLSLPALERPRAGRDLHRPQRRGGRGELDGGRPAAGEVLGKEAGEEAEEEGLRPRGRVGDGPEPAQRPRRRGSQRQLSGSVAARPGAADPGRAS